MEQEKRYMGKFTPNSAVRHAKDVWVRMYVYLIFVLLVGGVGLTVYSPFGQSSILIL